MNAADIKHQANLEAEILQLKTALAESKEAITALRRQRDAALSPRDVHNGDLARYATIMQHIADRIARAEANGQEWEIDQTAGTIDGNPTSEFDGSFTATVRISSFKAQGIADDYINTGVPRAVLAEMPE